MRSWFWLLPLVFLSCEVGAQVVRCRDAAGRTQFADRCPEGWRLVGEVRTDASPSAEGNGSSAPSWQQRETEFRIRLNERRSAEAIQRKEKELLAAECADARRRLEILEGGRPLIIRGAFTSNPEYLEDGQRAREIERQTRFLTECR